MALATILLGGAISGSAPIVFADADDKIKFEQLVSLALKAKSEKKCKPEQKYGDICDKKKPKIKITSPDKKEKVGSPVTITGTAEDKETGIKSVMVRIDKGDFVEADFDKDTGIWTFDAGTLDSGKHKATAKAIDIVGNEKRKTVKFEVDKKDPKIKITSPKKNAKVDAPVTITGTASDKETGIKSVMVRIDDGLYMPADFDKDTGTWTFTTGVLADGEYKATAKAVDFGNNEKTKSVKFEVV